MCFETSDNLLVACGDCVMTMKIKETISGKPTLDISTVGMTGMPADTPTALRLMWCGSYCCQAKDGGMQYCVGTGLYCMRSSSIGCRYEEEALQVFMALGCLYPTKNISELENDAVL